MNQNGDLKRLWREEETFKSNEPFNICDQIQMIHNRMNESMLNTNSWNAKDILKKNN